MNPKPCPFCGHDDPYMSNSIAQSEWYMVCAECNAIGPTGDSPNAALAAWNERVGVSQDEDEDEDEGADA